MAHIGQEDLTRKLPRDEATLFRRAFPPPCRRHDVTSAMRLDMPSAYDAAPLSKGADEGIQPFNSSLTRSITTAR